MCGIAGILLRGNATLHDLRERVEAMNAAQIHRGPDDGGVYLTPDGRAGIGNRRLAIRDLSPAGHMPMGNESGEVWITYNGELYNTHELRLELECLGYTFSSQSDTEVLLHGYEAWGEHVLDKLRGIYAFGILDSRDVSSPMLFLARDRLGVKPLYYAMIGTIVLFASELKALRASGHINADIDPAGLVGYLLLGSVPSPLTIYRGVRALEPGHCLTVPLGRASAPQPRQYWRFPTDVRDCGTEAEVIDEIGTLLEDSVRTQLVSDVPLGAFLSGGVDSSAVVALMRRATTGTIRTCSMIFEETEYNEAPYARAMAEAAGTEHYERVITAANLKEHLPRIFAAMDQPTVDGVNTYFVSETAREAGLTVSLSGLGGDELFGGYPNTFLGVPALVRAVGCLQAVPALSSLAARAIDVSPRRHSWAKASDALRRPNSPASSYLARRGLFSPTEVQRLVDPDTWTAAAASFEPLAHIHERAVQNGHDSRFGARPFAWVSRAELGTYTCDQLLRDTDVMSMAHSLEVRVPFLDHRLVETVLRLPASIVTGGTHPKALLMRAVGRSLPPEVRRPRAKQGFTLPLDFWLRKEFAGYRHSPDTVSARSMYVTPSAVAQVWKAYRAGHAHWSRAWALYALDGWAGESRLLTAPHQVS